MSWEQTLVTLVQPLCPRVEPDAAKPGTALPFVTYQAFGGQALRYLDTVATDKRHAFVQINVWAGTRAASTALLRQIEDALDVLLFDRSSRQAKLTEAGRELLREGARLLEEIDAVANRVKRVATGWEPQLTVAADGLMARPVLMELACAFFNLAPPTRLRIRDETQARGGREVEEEIGRAHV